MSGTFCRIGAIGSPTVGVTMPSFPTSLYRLQLRGDVDFTVATDLLPYLDDLGISHLYLSPIFTAEAGSTHGYDVIDPTQIDPALGGRAGFESLAKAAAARRIGIVLDIVPNHTAFSLENPWLRDVLRHGPDSKYARYFDLDAKDRIRLPMLDAPFEETVEKDTFSIEETSEGFVLVHGALRVPLADATAEHAGDLRTLHARQHWRLTNWRSERDAISHRRFFNITSLVGMRIEDPEVFEDTHRLIFDLVDKGMVHGLRIDHVDGLADPAQYLRRMADRLAGVPIWVEKILAADEFLPDWPVCGTTGYVVAGQIGQVLTSGEGGARLETLYRDRTTEMQSFPAMVRAAKREILTNDLAAELWVLHRMVVDLAERDPVGSEYGPEIWRQAIIGLIAAFPRYRTYLDADEASEEDRRLLNDAADAAAEPLDRRPIDLLTGWLLDGPEALRVRFQQVAGATMAKGQEDTAFYRYNRLLSANEVGAEPAEPAISGVEFQSLMRKRAEAMPDGVSLTTSHDTKRSEDARLRIAALSHHPEVMEQLLTQTDTLKEAAAVPANLRWYLIQSVWALPADAPDRAARLCEHAIKAMREAKQGTTWQSPDEAFEKVATQLVEALVAKWAAFPEQTQAAALTADRLSVAQLALKLTVPGVPDIYQGSEIACHLLTDPDNRRAVDWGPLRRALRDPSTLERPLDRAKFTLTRAMLDLRRQNPEFFRHASFEPIKTQSGTVGFQRRQEGKLLVGVVSTNGKAISGDVSGASVVWGRSASENSELLEDAAILRWNEASG